MYTWLPPLCCVEQRARFRAHWGSPISGSTCEPDFGLGRVRHLRMTSLAATLVSIVCSLAHTHHLRHLVQGRCTSLKWEFIEVNRRIIGGPVAAGCTYALSGTVHHYVLPNPHNRAFVFATVLVCPAPMPRRSAVSACRKRMCAFVAFSRERTPAPQERQWFVLTNVLSRHLGTRAPFYQNRQSPPNKKWFVWTTLWSRHLCTRAPFLRQTPLVWYPGTA